MSTSVAVTIKSGGSSETKARSSRRVTLRDVAERAAVKEACVSVVINGAKSNAHVSPMARERILLAAEELGYRRNGGMAAVATGRFGCVALLLSTKPGVSVLPSTVCEGINDGLSRQNVHLSLFRLPDEELTDKKRLPKILREWMADGMLIDYTHNIPADLKALIEGYALPAIWINSKQEFDCVRPNDLLAGIHATEHLLKLGHRRIAYLDLDMNCGFEGAHGHYSGLERYQGYLQAMEMAGATPQTLYGRGVHYSERAHKIEPLLKDCNNRPTAVVTYDSKTAEAVLWLAAHLGLEIPLDLSLVSIGVGIAYGGSTSVTAYQIPEYEIGRCASAMIQEKINTPHHHLPSQVLPFIFCQGNSTASLVL